MIKKIGKGVKLNIDDVVGVSRKLTKVELSNESFVVMNKSRNVVNKFVKNRKLVYGINTQFGGDVFRTDENMSNDSYEVYLNSLRNRQNNLIRSHNIGLGPKASKEVVRATMLLRTHAIAQGLSGARPEIAQMIIKELNKNSAPEIYKYGSIGASGDLIPLSSLADFLIKKGLKLEPKEGLALINGTSYMTGIASLAAYDLKMTFEALLCGLAMSLEAMLVIDNAYDDFIHQAKNHSGQIKVANFFADFWKDSKLCSDDGIQDYYSLRAIPQGFGPMYDNLTLAIKWIEEELNSVNDNPIIDFKSEKVFHGANFMGYYITESCDILKMDIAQASSWAHAVIANLIHPRKNKGLPGNLINNPEKYSGYKPVQLLTASLAVENRKLAVNHQAFMLPTEGDNQDVNSLGTHAAHDLKTAVENLERLTAIVLLAGAQALQLRGEKQAGTKSRKMLKKIREISPFLEKDRTMKKDIEKVIEAIRDGKFYEGVV